MEADNLKKWLDVAQQVQSEIFWKQMFDENNPNSSGNNSSHTPLTPLKEPFPKCDLYEMEQVLFVEAEIPGVLAEDLNISLEQQLLTISGEFKALKQNCNYFLKERAKRKFKKILTLPFPIVINQVKSEIQHGILYIVMPYNQEETENISITTD
jgi:HSP20 family protein